VTTGPTSQCSHCQRVRGPFSEGAPEGLDGPWCAAFPTGIPKDVYDNTRDHRQPLPGDHGLQWLAKPGYTYPRIIIPGVSINATT
jgi:hypothetical protein